jgi:hypothetical protein
MGLGTNQVTTAVAGNFIPEMWSDEVIAVYKQKLVLGNLVSKISFKGKKGDTLHIPVPSRGDASAKTANTQVNLIASTNGIIDILIDKHFEYSKLYEDIAEMQALSSMRKFYTEDAGYALARRIDRDLQLLGAGFNGGSIAGATNLYENAVLGGDGSTLFSGTTPGNGTAMTDAGLRKAIQTLEDNDINSSELNLVIPPVYGVEVFTTSNCPFIHVNSITSTQSVTFSATAPTGASFVDEFGLTVNWSTSSPTSTKYRACMLMHKDAMAHAEQMSIRSQSQYKQEYLGTLVTSDCVYGVKELRDYAALAIIVPA